MPWKRVVRSREVWAVTISYFCYGYVAWIFFSWFYRYLAKVRGLDLKASAFYSMLPFLAMLVCCLVGGMHQRPAYEMAGPAAGPLRPGSNCNVWRRHLYCLWIASSGCATGQHCAGRRRGGAVSCRRALSGRLRQILRGLGGFRFGVHEYGRANRRSVDWFPHTLDRRTLRMDSFVPGCSRIVPVRSSVLAGSESIEDIDPAGT